MKKSIVFIILIIVLFSVAYALDPDKSPHQYMVRGWTDRNGLPENSVRSLVESPDGYLWIAGERSISRFDGVRFKVFNSTTNSELRRVVIKSMILRQEGGFWIETQGRIGIFKNGKLRYPKELNPLTGLWFRGVRAGGGKLWVATARNGIYLFDGKIHRLGKEEGLPSKSIERITLGRDGVLYFATSEGFIGSVLDMSVSVIGSIEGEVSTLYADDRNVLWIGTMKNGLFSLENGVLKNFSNRNGLAGNSVESLGSDGDGALWVGTSGGGLSRIYGGRIESIGSIGGSKGTVTNIIEDREGNVWLSLYADGIVRLRNGKVKVYSVSSGLSSKTVSVLHPSRKGGVWVGTLGGGVDYISSTGIENHNLSDVFADSPYVYAVVEGEDDVLWAGVLGEGLLRFEGRMKRLYDASVHPWLKGIFSIFRDTDNSLWIGTIDGLLRFDGKKFTAYGESEGLSPQIVRGVYRDSRGVLWVVGNEKGIFYLSGGRFRNLGVELGKPELTAQSVAEDSTGSIWFSTFGYGIVRYRDGSLFILDEELGLPNNLVYEVVEDREGFLWASLGRGIVRFDRRDVDALAHGKKKRIDAFFIGNDEGLLSEDMMGGTQYNAVMDGKGRIWFASADGAVSIDPGNIPRNRHIPPIHIERVSVNGKASDKPERGAQMVFGPGVKQLEIDYTGISLTLPEKMEFSYRLEGFDEGWVEAGNRRTAYYTNVPPGSYRFFVKGKNSDGVENGMGEWVDMVVEPFFYETLLFRFLLGSGVVSLFSLLLFLKIRSVRRKEREMMQADKLASLGILVSGMAHEINNPNNYIKLNAEVLSSMWEDMRDVLDGHWEENPDFMLAGIPYGESREGVKDLIRGVANGSKRITSIVDNLKGFARKDSGDFNRLVDLNNVVESSLVIVRGLLKKSTSRFSFEPGENLPGIRGNFQQLEQVVINLLTNACHSLEKRSDPVTVRTECDRTSVRVVVEDGGMGIRRRDFRYIFDPFFTTKRNSGGTGLGLTVSDTIVKNHGGRLDIFSKPGEGTRVDVIFKRKGEDC